MHTEDLKIAYAANSFDDEMKRAESESLEEFEFMKDDEHQLFHDSKAHFMQQTEGTRKALPAEYQHGSLLILSTQKRAK